MPVVFLVRHGQASMHAEDYDVLSELGREQARIVGDELRRRGLRTPLVITGSLRRQRDTAAEALPEFGTPVLDERWDESEALQTYIATAHAAPNGAATDPPRSATAAAAAAEVDQAWVELATRTRAALDDLVTQLRAGQDGVVFTSAGIIASLSGQLFGCGPESVLDLSRVVVNASISKLIVGARGVSLVTFNEHAHLDGDRRALLTYA